jgi:hypothetical protein
MMGGNDVQSIYYQNKRDVVSARAGIVPIRGRGER